MATTPDILFSLLPSIVRSRKGDYNSKSFLLKYHICVCGQVLKTVQLLKLLRKRVRKNNTIYVDEIVHKVVVSCHGKKGLPFVFYTILLRFPPGLLYLLLLNS